jgi:CubicO group peptidase (beta-lactamase class C family)
MNIIFSSYVKLFLGFVSGFPKPAIKGTYVAVGSHHQFIRVDPDTRTVIVKLSATSESAGKQPQHLASFRVVVA